MRGRVVSCAYLGPCICISKLQKKGEDRWDGRDATRSRREPCLRLMRKYCRVLVRAARTELDLTAKMRTPPSAS